MKLRQLIVALALFPSRDSDHRVEPGSVRRERIKLSISLQNPAVRILLSRTMLLKSCVRT